MSRYRIFGAVAAVSIAFDQATKVYARRTLPGESQPVSFIDGYWDWVLEYNTGSAFSMFDGNRVFLTVVALVALGVIGWLVKSAKENQRGLVIALGLMAGGALGNLIDRILFGKVTDFVLWHTQTRYWPVFNIADVALVIAVPLFLFYGYKAEKQDKLAKAAAKTAGGEDEASAEERPAKKKPGSKKATKKKKKR